MESIFKVGDKVYDILFGWGEVEEITEDDIYPVQVLFFDGNREWYTLEGMWVDTDIKSRLSFTEYTLQGFSQERPFNPQDCIGKWCILSDNTLPSSGITLDKIQIYNGIDFTDTDGNLWENAKPLTEEQLQAFNLTND